jgi:hypothetical protein
MFIRDNYAKPGLVDQDVADHLEITPRYCANGAGGGWDNAFGVPAGMPARSRAPLLSSSAFASRSITEIAFECGFANSAHFSTEYRKRFGRSPRNYRQSHPRG